MNEAFCRCDRQPNKRFNPACDACAKINRNRKSLEAQRLSRRFRLEDQVQRLQTFNDLALNTLQELFDHCHKGAGEREKAWPDLAKKVKKVLA